MTISQILDPTTGSPLDSTDPTDVHLVIASVNPQILDGRALDEIAVKFTREIGYTAHTRFMARVAAAAGCAEFITRTHREEGTIFSPLDDALRAERDAIVDALVAAHPDGDDEARIAARLEGVIIDAMFPAEVRSMIVTEFIRFQHSLNVEVAATKAVKSAFSLPNVELPYASKAAQRRGALELAAAIAAEARA